MSGAIMSVGQRYIRVPGYGHDYCLPDVPLA